MPWSRQTQSAFSSPVVWPLDRLFTCVFFTTQIFHSKSKKSTRANCLHASWMTHVSHCSRAFVSHPSVSFALPGAKSVKFAPGKFGVNTYWPRPIAQGCFGRRWTWGNQSQKLNTLANTLSWLHVILSDIIFIVYLLPIPKGHFNLLRGKQSVTTFGEKNVLFNSFLKIILMFGLHLLVIHTGRAAATQITAVTNMLPTFRDIWWVAVGKLV